jgi:hypothetical protein
MSMKRTMTIENNNMYNNNNNENNSNVYVWK